MSQKYYFFQLIRIVVNADPDPVLRIRDVYPGFDFSSVADPGCLSRIPDPDFYPSRISDPGSRIQKQQQKREVKKK
jgi:hypothetical protein